MKLNNWIGQTAAIVQKISQKRSSVNHQGSMNFKWDGMEKLVVNITWNDSRFLKYQLGALFWKETF